MSKAKTNKPSGAATTSAAAFRAAVAKEKPRTATLRFPPGVMLEVQRVDIGTYVAAGMIPQHLVKLSMGAKDGAATSAQEMLADLSPEDLLALVQVIPRFTLAAVVSPKVVLGEPKADEISLLEIPEDTQKAIFQWVMSGCPGISVSVGGRDVEVEDLNRFRQKRPGGGFVDDGPDGGEVREASQPVVADL